MVQGPDDYITNNDYMQVGTVSCNAGCTNLNGGSITSSPCIFSEYNLEGSQTDDYKCTNSPSYGASGYIYENVFSAAYQCEFFEAYLPGIGWENVGDTCLTFGNPFDYMNVNAVSDTYSSEVNFPQIWIPGQVNYPGVFTDLTTQASASGTLTTPPPGIATCANPQRGDSQLTYSHTYGTFTAWQATTPATCYNGAW